MKKFITIAREKVSEASKDNALLTRVEGKYFSDRAVVAANDLYLKVDSSAVPVVRSTTLEEV